MEGTDDDDNDDDCGLLVRDLNLDLDLDLVFTSGSLTIVFIDRGAELASVFLSFLSRSLFTFSLRGVALDRDLVLVEEDEDALADKSVLPSSKSMFLPLDN